MSDKKLRVPRRSTAAPSHWPTRSAGRRSLPGVADFDLARVGEFQVAAGGIAAGDIFAKRWRRERANKDGRESMKTKHANSGLRMGSLACALLLFSLGASCSVGGGDEGSPSVITIDSSDITPAPKSDDANASSGSNSTPTSSGSNPTQGTSGTGTLESQEVTIAKCLSSKGAVLYGADWCTYTKQQIDSFKDGFQYLSYVECTEQSALCEEKGITGYPTWIIGGSHLAGYRSPTSIGSSAGCSW